MSLKEKIKDKYYMSSTINNKKRLLRWVEEDVREAVNEYLMWVPTTSGGYNLCSQCRNKKLCLMSRLQTDIYICKKCLDNKIFGDWEEKEGII